MHSRTIARIITLLALLSALGGCGGADDTQDASEEPSSAGEAPSVSEVQATEGSGGVVCDVIRSVQADLLPDAVSEAYLAQFTIRLDPALFENRDALDRAATQECPDEYALFLEQAQISSLEEL
jgi:hypothetical protein